MSYQIDLEDKTMLDTYEDTKSRVADQAPTQPTLLFTASQQAVPGYMQIPPTTPPVIPRRSHGMRTGAIVALSLVLLLVLGVGLFAGWQFGRTSRATGGVTLQPGTGSQSAVPALTGNDEQAVREAVLPSAPGRGEVNVTTQQVHRSGVIVDGRGYIVTNNQSSMAHKV